MQLNLGPLESLITTLLKFIDSTLVPVIFAIAFVFFLWSVYLYFIAGGASEEKRDTGKQYIMYSIIGFVVMLSVWGIVNLLISTLNFENTKPDLPTFEKGS